MPAWVSVWLFTTCHMIQLLWKELLITHSINITSHTPLNITRSLLALLLHLMCIQDPKVAPY